MGFLTLKLYYFPKIRVEDFGQYKNAIVCYLPLKIRRIKKETGTQSPLPYPHTDACTHVQTPLFLSPRSPDIKHTTDIAHPCE